MRFLYREVKNSIFLVKKSKYNYTYIWYLGGIIYGSKENDVIC